MWSWPEPEWVMCWPYHPSTNSRCSWGFAQWQPILVYGKDPYLATGRGARPTFFSHARPPDREVTGDHPCPKPEPLIRWLVERVTLPTDLVIDPFMGSGTTLRAAMDLGRRAIGIELTEGYCETAAARLAQQVLPLPDLGIPELPTQLSFVA